MAFRYKSCEDIGHIHQCPESYETLVERTCAHVPTSRESEMEKGAFAEHVKIQ